ncbi:MAG: hypothetical protein M5R36_07270 [Deltaproteobacteria bacterium]|nr:hypothetical protein [Deltaproteobacteria bacterium]
MISTSNGPLPVGELPRFHVVEGIRIEDVNVVDHAVHDEQLAASLVDVESADVVDRVARVGADERDLPERRGVRGVERVERAGKLVGNEHPLVDGIDTDAHRTAVALQRPPRRGQDELIAGHRIRFERISPGAVDVADREHGAGFQRLPERGAGQDQNGGRADRDDKPITHASSPTRPRRKIAGEARIGASGLYQG